MGKAIGIDRSERFFEVIGSVSHRMRCVISFVAGALSVLSMAPFFLWPLLFFTFPVLLLILDAELRDEPKRLRPSGFFSSHYFRVGVIGWFFGFGYFVAGLYWFAHAFLVEADRFALLIPLAVLAMPAFLSLFYALAVVPVCFVSGRVARYFSLVFGFGVMEWLRGHILTGFPWNALGYGLTANDGMLQLASLFGLYGLNFLAVLFFAAPFLIIGYAEKGGRKRSRTVFAIVMALMAVAASWGYYRLNIKRDLAFVEGVQLRLVQPNIPQIKKMDLAYVPWNFRELLRYSNTVNGKFKLDGMTHLIWPEVAVRALLAEQPDAISEIAKLLPDGVSLIAGSLRREQVDDSFRVYNSLMVFDDQARLKAVYDKTHLVPFGEYLPLQWLLERIGLEQITRQKGGFSAGDGTRWMKADGLPPFSPLICYEAVFPDKIYQAGKRPEWLLNVTNDAWFGDSTGPYQHFHQSRVRAVEEGLPLVRVANTGVSGVIDAYGVVLQKMPYGVGGIIDHRLPKAIPLTYYSWWRYFIFPIFAFLSILLMVVSNKELN